MDTLSIVIELNTNLCIVVIGSAGLLARVLMFIPVLCLTMIGAVTCVPAAVEKGFLLTVSTLKWKYRLDMIIEMLQRKTIPFRWEPLQYISNNNTH